MGRAGYGIFAKSVGGGGGSVSSTAAVNALIGSTGGDGGHSGNVEITNTGSGTITTKGKNAIGIYALAIGGGGGDIGSTKGNVSLGATGGEGGSAGNITITNEGSIRTYGYNSYGIIANSVGAGGGRIAENISNDSITLGASGGARGNSGNITINNSGDISTFGKNSIPLQLSSIGGGGGNGGTGYKNIILGGRNTKWMRSGEILYTAGAIIPINFHTADGYCLWYCKLLVIFTP